MIDCNGIGFNKKQTNILMILNQIAMRKETYATDIIKATGLSSATVSRSIIALKKVNVVTYKGKEITDMGRHPDIYGLNADYGCLLHFFVDTESIQGYLSDFCGNILAHGQIEIDRNITPDVFGEKLRSCSEDLIGKHKIAYSGLLAVSIAIPGMVDIRKRVIKRIPNFVNFKNVNLFHFAEKSMQVPVIINNEARLCAFGAFIHAFPEKRNLIYIDFTKYSGIGAGIVVDGKLVEGQGGSAGEIGDILVDVHNLNNGYHEEEGCLEAMAGVGVLFSKIYAMFRNGRANILKDLMEKEGINTLTLEVIERAVLMQDLDVIDVFNDIMKMWAIAIINLSAILDPELLILGGVVNEKNKVVLTRIRHYVSKIMFHDINIVLGETSDYQMYGGLHMLKTYVLNNILAKKLFD